MRQRKRYLNEFTPRYLYDDSIEEPKFSAFSAHSLKDYYNLPFDTLNKPATIIRKQGERYSLETVFDTASPEKGAVFLKERHSTEAFSVVVADAHLTDEDQAFARAAVAYTGQFHGLDLGLNVSKSAIHLMTEALLTSSPRKIDINFDLVWGSWKLKNKEIKIETIEFKLKRKQESLALIVGHTSKVFLETELLADG
jgi:hypothetical protein